MKKFINSAANRPDQFLLKPAGLSFVLLFCIMLLSTKAYSQLAPVNPPAGGFRIDGGLKANTPSINEGDWVFGPGGSGDSVIRYNGVPFNTTTTKFVRDAFNSASDLIFTGSSFSDNPNAWKWTTGAATNKCDINNAMFLATTSATNKWVILGGDRLTTTGTSYIDFEFYQGDLTRNPDGTFTSVAHGGGSLAATNGRTPGDFVLSMEYSNGGVTATIHYYAWENSGGWKYVEHPIPSPGGVPSAFGATNGTATDVPFGAFGSSSYIPFAFAEAAVNIDAILTGQCQSVSINTIFIKTKASDSYNAALKDFVEPQTVNFVFGNAGLSYGATNFCHTGTAAPTIPSSPQGAFSSSAGLSINGTTGVIDLGASTTGNYTVTYTPTGGVCLQPANVSITINPIPSAGISGTTTVCKDATAPFVVFTGSGGTRPYTFSYNTGSGTLTRTTTGGFDTARIAASTVNAGTVTYTLTGVVDANCSNTASGTAVITVNPKPSASISGTTTLCKDATVPFVVFTGSGGTRPYTFSYNIGGGTLTRTTTGSFDTARIAASTTTPGTVTYTLTGVSDANCSNAASGTASITVTPKPSASISGTTTVCKDATALFVVFTGSGGTRPYTFSYNTGGGTLTRTTTGSFDTARVAVPTVVPGTVTYTLTGVSDASCSNTANGTAVVTVNSVPTAPTICIIQPSLCGPSKGSIKVLSPLVPGYQYSKDDGATWQDCNVFLQVDAGSNPVIRYKTAAGCVSASSTCSDATTCAQAPVACAPGSFSKAAPVTQTNETSQTTVKAYPNPFNDKVKFVVTSAIAGQGNLEVYNTMGQKIKTVYQGFMVAGSQTFELSLPTQQVANLFYVLRVGDKQVTGKLLQLTQ